MFRRRTSQETPGFDAGTGINVTSEPASRPKQQQDAQQQVHDAVAAFRQDRRISGDRLAGSTTDASVPGQRTTARARVQQAPGSPLVPLQLAPLQLLKPPSLHTQPGAVQGFSVFSNPLSSPIQSALQAAAAPAAAKQPAALQQYSPTASTVVDGLQQAAHTAAPVSLRQQQVAPEQQRPQQHSQLALATAADTGSPAAAETSQAVLLDKDAAVTPTGTPLKQSCLLNSKALRFEVSAAGDSDGNDQQLLGPEHVRSDEGLQQQYFYDEVSIHYNTTLCSDLDAAITVGNHLFVPASGQSSILQSVACIACRTNSCGTNCSWLRLSLQDTGQLVRVGEGADTTRLARHYVEDWNTGEFFQLAEPSSAWRCFGWFR